MELTSKQIWDMASKVASHMTPEALFYASKEDLISIDRRCAHLIENDNYSADNQTLKSFKSLVKFHLAAQEAGYKVVRETEDKEELVRSIVSDILMESSFDENEIVDVLVDDNGNCIHVEFSGGATTKTIQAIGEAFGDDNPNIYASPNNCIKLVIINEKVDQLKDSGS